MAKDTVNVYMPPQFSRLKRLLKLWLTKGAIFLRSCVLTRVASRDWWASLKVVSISRRPWCCLIARAKPSGPSLNKTSRKPVGGSPGQKKEVIWIHSTPYIIHDEIYLANLKPVTKKGTISSVQYLQKYVQNLGKEIFLYLYL